MILLTKSLKDRLVKNYHHHKKYWNDEHPKYKEFKAVVKLFNPSGVGTWYLSELNADTNVAFGLACIQDKELGYIDLNELSQVKGQFGLKIESDRYFTPNKKTLEECKTLN